MSDRLDYASVGLWVLQDFDVNDITGAAYDFTGDAVGALPGNFGARYGWYTNASGLPEWGALINTFGFIGGWIYWPPDDHSPRTVGQWGTCFAAQITGIGPLQATPVETAAGPWAVSTSLLAQNVATSDGSSPAIGTFGLVIRGTAIGSQELLFFRGGGGSSLIMFQIDSYTGGGGLYNAHQVDPVTALTVMGGISTSKLLERGVRSDALDPGLNVYCQHETSGGDDYYVTVLPMEPCS